MSASLIQFFQPVFLQFLQVAEDAAAATPAAPTANLGSDISFLVMVLSIVLGLFLILLSVILWALSTAYAKGEISFKSSTPPSTLSTNAQ